MAGVDGGQGGPPALQLVLVTLEGLGVVLSQCRPGRSLGSSHGLGQHGCTRVQHPAPLDSNLRMARVSELEGGGPEHCSKGTVGEVRGGHPTTFHK